MLNKEQIEAIATKLLAPYDVNFNVIVNLEAFIPAQIFIRRPDSTVSVVNFFERGISNDSIFLEGFNYRLEGLELPLKEVSNAN
jgi:hypothetical protein